MKRFLYLVAILFLLSAPILLAQDVPPMPPTGSSEVPLATLIRITAVLVGAKLIYYAINGIKDAKPEWFAAHPNVARIWNAVGQLIVVSLACLGGDHPSGAMNILGIVVCFITGVVGYLATAGVYQEKKVENIARSSATTAAFDKAVEPPKS